MRSSIPPTVEMIPLCPPEERVQGQQPKQTPQRQQPKSHQGDPTGSPNWMWTRPCPPSVRSQAESRSTTCPQIQLHIKRTSGCCTRRAGKEREREKGREETRNSTGNLISDQMDGNHVPHCLCLCRCPLVDEMETQSDTKQRVKTW